MARPPAATSFRRTLPPSLFWFPPGPQVTTSANPARWLSFPNPSISIVSKKSSTTPRKCLRSTRVPLLPNRLFSDRRRHATLAKACGVAIEGRPITPVVPRLRDERRIIPPLRSQQRAVDISESGASAQQHRFIQFPPQNFQHMRGALLPASGQPPQDRSPDQHRTSAKRNRLKHIAAAPDSAVDIHFATIAHRFHDMR